VWEERKKSEELVSKERLEGEEGMRQHEPDSLFSLEASASSRNTEWNGLTNLRDSLEPVHLLALLSWNHLSTLRDIFQEPETKEHVFRGAWCISWAPQWGRDC
jgi:hypothetical protein